MRLGWMGKLLVGLATAWPLVYMVYFMVTVFSGVMSLGHGGGLGLASFQHLLGMHLATIFISIALLIFYIVHLVKNQRLNDNNKLMWAILLMMGGIVAMPVYLVAHVLPKPQSDNRTQ